MKKLLGALLLLSSGLATAQVNPADYHLPVHVVSSRLATDCREVLGRTYCSKKQDLEVIIDGEKYELLGKDDIDSALRIGDYQARALTADATDGADPVPAYEIDHRNTYEFLLPDGRKQKYSIIGESE